MLKYLGFFLMMKLVNIVNSEENFLNEKKKNAKKLHRNVILNFKNYIQLIFIQELNN